MSDYDNARKIVWCGREVELVFLIKMLINKKYLQRDLQDKIYVFIRDHFVKEDGRPFKIRQLAQTSYQCDLNKTGKPRRAQSIENMLEVLSRYFD
ncbi:MAG: hypothetical protein GF353_00110 [Candidatus Lokiarchaeota archaeon]|nr:hypothetical protein [Candidatus Lokiarchaeota archaeon]